MSYSELPPAILQTSSGYFIVTKDTRLDSIQNTQPRTSSLNGVLINLFGAAASCGNQLTMRVIRKNITHNKTHYVDIPIVGSAVLYDDGHSLGTYEWRERDVQNEPPEVLSGGVNVSSITYVGDELITTK